MIQKTPYLEFFLNRILAFYHYWNHKTNVKVHQDGFFLLAITIAIRLTQVTNQY